MSSRLKSTPNQGIIAARAIGEMELLYHRCSGEFKEVNFTARLPLLGSSFANMAIEILLRFNLPVDADCGQFLKIYE